MSALTGESYVTPIISVVLPVYNGERYIFESVNSILNQTFRDFEIIIIDDGSTDETASILIGLSKRDSRIVLISRENRGLVASLNEGIELARGVWVARMDADDISLNVRFERQLQWLQETGADLCGCWVKYFGTVDKRVLRHCQTDEAVKAEMLFGSPFAHPTVFVRAALLKQLRYDRSWESCEDYDLWERAARAGWRMTNVPEVLLHYRQHASQVSTLKTARQNELSQQIRLRYWLYFLDELKLDRAWAVEVLKLREPKPPAVDMDIVDSTFDALLKCSYGERRAVIFDHMTRLYLRSAADCRNVVKRWGLLNARFGNGYAVNVKIKMHLLSLFRIGPSSRFFHYLKSLYFYVSH